MSQKCRSHRCGLRDRLLFLLAQADQPDHENRLDALDDPFGELSPAERSRLAGICEGILAGVWQART